MDTSEARSFVTVKENVQRSVNAIIGKARKAEPIQEKLIDNKFFTPDPGKTEELKQGTIQETLSLMEKCTALLDSPYTIIVLGEKSSGKSTFINSLIERELLPWAQERVDTSITILSWGETESGEVIFDGGEPSRAYSIEEALSYSDHRKHKEEILDRVLEIRVSVNNSFLKTVRIVNTAGLHDFFFSHEKREKRILELAHSADCIFWMFSGPAPHTDYEDRLLGSFKRYNRKIVGVINIIDEVPSDDIDSVRKGIYDSFHEILAPAESYYGYRNKALFMYSGKKILNSFTPDMAQDKAAVLREKYGYDNLMGYLRDTHLSPDSPERKDHISSTLERFADLVETSLMDGIFSALDSAISKAIRDEDEKAGQVQDLIDNLIKPAFKSIRMRIQTQLCRELAEWMCRKLKNSGTGAVENKFTAWNIITSPMAIKEALKNDIKEAMSEAIPQDEFEKMLRSRLTLLLREGLEDLQSDIKQTLDSSSPGLKGPQSFDSLDVSGHIADVHKQIVAIIAELITVLMSKVLGKVGQEAIEELIKVILKKATKQLLSKSIPIIGWLLLAKLPYDIIKMGEKIEQGKKKLIDSLELSVDEQKPDIEMSLYADIANYTFTLQDKLEGDIHEKYGSTGVSDMWKTGKKELDSIRNNIAPIIEQIRNYWV